MKELRRRYGCPVEFALDCLGGKWKVVLLARLKSGPMRYSELRAPGLADKVLTERLHDLVKLELIAHLPAGPDTLPSYRLTERGERLRPALQALFDWGEEEARARDIDVGAQS